MLNLFPITSASPRSPRVSGQLVDCCFAARPMEAPGLPHSRQLEDKTGTGPATGRPVWTRQAQQWRCSRIKRSGGFVLTHGWFTAGDIGADANGRAKIEPAYSSRGGVAVDSASRISMLLPEGSFR